MLSAIFLIVATCLIQVISTESTTTLIELVAPTGGPLIGAKILVNSPPKPQSIDRFLGIPYATPPVGKLRFRRPQPKASWSEPIRALEWPSNCVQHQFFKDKYQSQNFSEDCLYLNVWSPDILVREEELKPVIVWIHGGGLHFGASSFDLYDGEVLAAMADAVVVTFNYRLSTIGFMYSDEVSDIKGNQGLWDQALALKWVKENIRQFGGDPNRITIMGESAGSWSVSLHILSPITRDLFKDAIMMSGAAIIKTVLKPQQMVQKLLPGLRKVGCATEADKSINQKVIECLENLDPEKVDEIAYLVKYKLDFLELFVEDGEFIPEWPVDMLLKGDHKKNFNLLISTAEDEGSFLLHLGGQNAQFRKENPDPITLEQAKEFLVEAMAKDILRTNTVNNATMIKAYFSGLNGHFDKPDLYRRAVGIAYGDLFLKCPTIEFARILAGKSDNNVQVHQWYYHAKMGQIKWLCSKWGGTCHGDCLYPVFGVPFRHEQDFFNRERDISAEVINILRSFIRNGTPGPFQPEWMSYFMTNGKKDLIAPYYEITNLPKTEQNFKFNLQGWQCDKIWRQFIYNNK